jgi:hypothetical protein
MVWRSKIGLDISTPCSKQGSWRLNTQRMVTGGTEFGPSARHTMNQWLVSADEGFRLPDELHSPKAPDIAALKVHRSH